MQRLHPSAGIAIGPILFLLAILGVIASVMASSGGGGGFGAASVSDRVTADIVSQANMIRAKVNECQLQYLTNGQTYASAPCENDAYPCSDQTNGTLVSALTCPNDPLISGAEQSLWTGLRPSQLPQPTAGFKPWRYMNGGDSGGRCFWTSLSGSKTGTLISGLKRAAQKFTSAELAYDDTTNSQKFVVFITTPTGTATDNCQSKD